MFLFMVPMLIDDIPMPPRPAVVVTVTTVTQPKPKAVAVVKPKTVVTTTTTMPKTFLSMVQAQVGKTPQEIGIEFDFWCAKFVEWALVQTGWTDTDAMDAPSWLMREFPPTSEPAPGDLVFFSFQQGSGQADHVGVVESLNPLVIIDGNGLSETHVLRGEPTYEIAGYAKTGR
jgi:hypothetical protein